MILKELGQDFKYGTQTFVVGGMASVPMENGRQFGIIQKLDVENESYPSALCGFGKEDMRRLPLEDVKDTEDPIQWLTLSSAYAGQESNLLWFSYDGNEPPGPVCLCYNIEPVPVYSEAKGGTAI